MDIKNLHQVGEKTSKILNKLGIFTDDDLINYYPYRYNVYNFSKPQIVILYIYQKYANYIIRRLFEFPSRCLRVDIELTSCTFLHIYAIISGSTCCLCHIC